MRWRKVVPGQTALCLAALDLTPLVAATPLVATGGRDAIAWWAAAAVVALAMVPRNAAAGLYSRPALRFSILEAESLLRHALGGLVLAAALWLFLDRNPGAVRLAVWWCASMATTLLLRSGAGRLLFARRQGPGRAFLIGQGLETEAVIEGIRSRVGVEPVMVKCDEDGAVAWEEGSISPPSPRAGDEVWVAASELAREYLPTMLQRWRAQGIDVRVFRSPLHPCLDLRDRFTVRGVSLIALRRHDVVGGSLGLKRAFDMVFAAALVVVTLPLWLVIMAAIRLDSPGPVFFRQRRVGRGGREFNMLKFRSMCVGEAYENKPMSAMDPRITRVGRLLRRTGVDELPQILNVLRGQMSFVGPRPEMPFKVARYTARERERLLAVPGITGLWQLNVHRSNPIHHALEYDLYYIENQSLLLDLVIIGRTVLETLKGVFWNSIFDV